MLIFIFLSLIFAVFLVLLLSTMNMAAENQRQDLNQRTHVRHIASLDEVNQAFNAHIGTNLMIAVALCASIILGVLLYNGFKTYEHNKIIFGQWIEHTYDVNVDYERAAGVTCYLGILHYPQKNASSLLPYPQTIHCDASEFENKKRQLDIENKPLKQLLLSLGFLTAVLVFVLGVFLRYWLTQPKLEWVKLNTRLKLF